nr:PREDICTED: uncharacterized protein LOC105674786 [Linepithema humile]
MERLILLCLLLSPVILAQPRESKDPNDEPFLPIFPDYPYTPKVIKRGAERELTTQLTPELYAPKVDAKNSYSSSYNTNYQRDPYYNPDPRNSSPAPAYPSYYNGDAYAYVHSPYAVYNTYPTPYAVNPASYPVSYPNYYYQQPYYSHYYNHALFPPPLPPSPPPPPHQETSQDSAEDDRHGKQSKKLKDDETSQNVPSTSQYVDGGNYISGGGGGGSRDLDVQSSTYKLAGPYNQLEGNVQVRNLPIPLPKATYRLINVAGQPVNPNYPLPTTYIKIQQMEQQVSQALARLLAQQQAGQSYGNHREHALNADANGGLYANVYNLNAAPYVTLPTVKTKPAVAFVINADGTAKVNGGQASSQDSSAQRNKGTKSSVLYVRKPATLESSQTASPKQRASDSRSADQTDEYDGYGASQSYADDKQKSNYYQSGSSYQSKDLAVTPRTPQPYSYQYSAYASDETQQPQSQGDKITTDSNFGAKQYNKG